MPRITKRVVRRLLISSALALGVAGLLAGVYRLDVFATAQARATDLMFRSRAPGTARAVVIVGIDQRSYRELLPEYGPLVNWPRRLYARAITRLMEAGPRVIALDVFFDAPQVDDAEVAAALRRATVLTPVEAQGPRRLGPAPGIAQEFDVFVRPTETVRAAAAGEGFVNVSTDRDTVVRALPLLLRAGGDDVPALALTAVARYVRRKQVVDAPPADHRVYAAGRAIPLVAGERMVINYLGPPSSPERGGSFTIIPFVDVLNGHFDRSLVADRIVLLGLTIRGLDEFSTPTTAETRMWGVEVLGTAIETIVGQRFLVPAPARFTVAAMVGLALVAGLFAATWRPLVATLGAVLLLIAYLVFADFRFESGVVLDLVHPPAALLLAFATTLVYRVRFGEAEERFVRDAMGRYLAPTVSRWLLDEPERLNLGGETRDMSVMFCDIRSFTGFSEMLGPGQIVAILNEFMTTMTTVVFENDGVVDKYIGDNIMAFWNAPMSQPDHSARACRTALAMLEALRPLQESFTTRGWPRIDIGIGINTGPMVVGNMGSRQRLAYTVIGDTVNVASRLEGLCKQYGTRVVVGEATRAAGGDAFHYRFLDRVAVKGRQLPLDVWEVVARGGTLTPARRAWLQQYHEAIELYRTRRWAEGLVEFGRLLEAEPADGPAAIYRERCRILREEPPPPDWDMVFVATTK